jgi:hypothetical protein
METNIGIVEQVLRFLLGIGILIYACNLFNRKSGIKGKARPKKGRK